MCTSRAYSVISCCSNTIVLDNASGACILAEPYVPLAVVLHKHRLALLLRGETRVRTLDLRRRRVDGAFAAREDAERLALVGLTDDRIVVVGTVTGALTGTSTGTLFWWPVPQHHSDAAAHDSVTVGQLSSVDQFFVPDVVAALSRTGDSVVLTRQTYSCYLVLELWDLVAGTGCTQRVTAARLPYIGVDVCLALDTPRATVWFCIDSLFRA